MAVAEHAALVPPHDLEAEQAVLGGILLSEKRLYDLVIREGLRATDFYRRQHALVYEAILDLYNASAPVDALTVRDRLAERGDLDEAGGEALVYDLAAAPPVAGNVGHYATIVRKHSQLRRVLNAVFETQSEVLGHEADADDLVSRAQQRMLEVTREDGQQDFRSIGDVLDVALDQLQDLSKRHESIVGTPSGFRDLDAITGGFRPGNLVVLAARPSMGKSALVTNIAEKAALELNKPVALFSLEMSEAELAQRFVASQASIKGDELSRGRVAEGRWSKIMVACQKLANAPLYIDDSSDIGITEIRAKCRRLHQQHDGLGLVIVDYLQLMRADGRTDNRVEQVALMSRGLKILSREMQVPVIALSQLSRGLESRVDKVPLLSDLRESGAIEQDADLVMFIYRDEYYTKEESERPGEADIVIAKHRNGGLGTATLAFRGEYPKFMDMAREDRYL